MFVIRAKLAASPIHGLGTFAEEPIRKGQLIWIFDPRFDLVLSESEIRDLPDVVREYCLVHSYSESREGKEFFILSVDDSKYMNHSDSPNAIETKDKLGNIAAADILVGEEITCDYRAFDLRADEKLSR